MPTRRADRRMFRRAIPIVGLLALATMLSSCESFDPSDWFNTKKPLPGERKEMFPEGVPGVPQGVPAELVQGYKPPAEEPPKEVAEEKPKPVKPKPKPKPKTVAAPAAQPAPQAASSPSAGAQAPWPNAHP